MTSRFVEFAVFKFCIQNNSFLLILVLDQYFLKLYNNFKSFLAIWNFRCVTKKNIKWSLHPFHNFFELCMNTQILNTYDIDFLPDNYCSPYSTQWTDKNCISNVFFFNIYTKKRLFYFYVHDFFTLNEKMYKIILYEISQR